MQNITGYTRPTIRAPRLGRFTAPQFGIVRPLRKQSSITSTTEALLRTGSYIKFLKFINAPDNQPFIPVDFIPVYLSRMTEAPYLAETYKDVIDNALEIIKQNPDWLAAVTEMHNMQRPVVLSAAGTNARGDLKYYCGVSNELQKHLQAAGIHLIPPRHDLFTSIKGPEISFG